jgi:hypothetical protein
MYRWPEYHAFMSSFDNDVPTWSWLGAEEMAVVDGVDRFARSLVFLIMGVLGVVLVIALLVTPSASAAGGCGGG